MGEVMGAVLIFYMQSMIRVHSTGRNVTLLDMVQVKFLVLMKLSIHSDDIPQFCLCFHKKLRS